MKPPSFNFYYQDFLIGTHFMSNEAVGAYIRCLCHQAHDGSISPEHMKKICFSSEIQNEVQKKFSVDSETGNFFNQRLLFEVEKRKEYVKSRSINRKSKSSSNESTSNHDEHMKNISNSYDKHMEIEIENEIDNSIKEPKSKKFIPPTLPEVIEFFQAKGFSTDAAKKAFDYYHTGDWKGSDGKQVRNWKQKMIAVWFKDEYKTTPKQIESTRYSRNPVSV